MAAKNKKWANKVPASKKQSDIMSGWDSMKPFRSMAIGICPEVKDDEVKVGEIALMLYQFGKALNIEYAAISKLCDTNTDTKVSFAFAVTIDRRCEPPEIKSKLAYTEKHGLTFTAQVPDSNQDELPLLDGKKTTEDGGDTGGSAEAPEADADKN